MIRPCDLLNLNVRRLFIPIHPRHSSHGVRSRNEGYPTDSGLNGEREIEKSDSFY